MPTTHENPWAGYDNLKLSVYNAPGEFTITNFKDAIAKVTNLVNEWHIQTSQTQIKGFQNIRNFGLKHRKFSMNVQLLEYQKRTHTSIDNFEPAAFTPDLAFADFFNQAVNFTPNDPSSVKIYEIEHPQIAQFNINFVYIERIATPNWNAKDGINFDIDFVEYLFPLPEASKKRNNQSERSASPSALLLQQSSHNPSLG